MGYISSATGLYATTFGFTTLASAPASTAFGYNTEARGTVSTATGLATKANGYASLVIGQYNDTIVAPQTNSSSLTPLFIIGNGANETMLSNAMVVRKDGNTGIGTSSPACRLHVSQGPGGNQYHADAAMIIEDDFRTYLQFSTPSNHESGILSGNAASSIRSGIIFAADSTMSFRTGGNIQRMFITKTGNVGIGTTAPARKAEISGSGLQAIRITSTNSDRAALEFKRTGGGSDWRIVDSTGLLFFGQSSDDLVNVNEVVRMGGSSLTPAVDNAVTLGNSSLRWTAVYAVNGTIQTSDARDKRDIARLQSALAKVMQLKPVTYTWKDQHIDAGKTHHGFLAQDILDVIPEVVITHEWKEAADGTSRKWAPVERLGINYSELIPVLTNALQELAIRIDDQQEVIMDQNRVIEELLARVAMLEADR